MMDRFILEQEELRQNMKTPSIRNLN